MRFLYSSIFLSLLAVCNISARAQTTSTEVVTQPATTTTTVVERQVIQTPAPAAKEVINTPEGYAKCVTIPGGMVKDPLDPTKERWVSERRTCVYENKSEGFAWVDSYWACIEYELTNGVCKKWEWVPGHWVQTVAVY